MKSLLRITSWASLVLLVESSAHAQIPCRYEVTVLPQVDCGFWQGAGAPSAINNHGHVVGHFDQCGCCGNDSFIWYGGPTLTYIQRPPWMHSFLASDISDDGLIVGTAETDWAGQRGYIYNTNTGDWTELLPQSGGGPDWSSASTINSSGVVCGRRSVDDGGDPVNPYAGAIWLPSGEVVDWGPLNGPNSGASAISNSDIVVGWTGSNAVSNSTRAVIHQAGVTQVLGPVPNGFTSIGWSANSMGQMIIAGRVGQPSDYVVRSFIYQKGSFTELLPLPGFAYSIAGDLAESGLAVGVSRNPSGSKGVLERASIWESTEAIDPNTLIDAGLELTLWGLHDINQHGKVIASGASASAGAVVVLLTPSIAMMGDANCDGVVNVSDLLEVVRTWGSCAGCPTDFVEDDTVNVLDLLAVIQHWS